MKSWSAALGCVFLLVFSANESSAQSQRRIFDIEFGTPASSLPADEWVEPACGTDGGPPSLELESFEQFARCPAEDETGLHEVWFIYDDEWEYIARAYRDPVEIGRYSANVFYGQPIMTSLLIDDAGLVQGYRIVTDPEAVPEVRRQAHSLHPILKTQFASPESAWECTDLPPGPEETPVEGEFLKQDCILVTEDRYIKLEGRLLRKPGQDRFNVAPEGYFESSTRVEVFNRDIVKDERCCAGSAR